MTTPAFHVITRAADYDEAWRQAPDFARFLRVIEVTDRFGIDVRKLNGTWCIIAVPRTSFPAPGRGGEPAAAEGVVYREHTS